MLTKKKKERSGYWYAVLYAGGNKRRWVSTKTADKAEAQAFHDALEAKMKAERLLARRNQILGILPPPEPEKPKVISFTLPQLWEKYLKINPAPSQAQAKTWNIFAKWCEKNSVETTQDLTSEKALEYLSQLDSGKTFNTYKSGLSAIFKKVAIFKISNPFEAIANRTTDSQNYRALTDSEVIRLLEHTSGFWHSAVLISYYTGLRKLDVHKLKWNNIKDGIIELVPSKTKKFKRAVYIHLHPELVELFAELRKTALFDSDYIFPEAAEKYGTGAWNHQLQQAFKSAKIFDTKDGKASFHSLRASFITNCERSGIDRRVIQGIVGHASPHMTEHYSQDKESGRILKSLPALTRHNAKTVKS